MQRTLTPRYSLVIPVYRNAESLPDLISALRSLDKNLEHRLQVVFVVDGSPDQSYAMLKDLIPESGLEAKLVALSRNFGSFAAIREGLSQADGELFAVMAADLQEPPELVLTFFRLLDEGGLDVIFGLRESREDPFFSRMMSGIFWWIYRRFVQSEVPVGGVDVFAVDRSFRDRVIGFQEANSSLLGLLFWMGGRRKFVSYHRRERKHGKSAWTFSKKFTYLLDSVFAFTDAPIRLLLASGLVGLLLSCALAVAVFIGKLLGLAAVPGYAATILTILFFGGLNALGLGLVGNYSWRAYENTKQRPLSIPMLVEVFERSLHEN